LRSQWPRDGGECSGLHGVALAGSRGEPASDARAHRVDRQHRQRRDRTRAPTRAACPVPTRARPQRRAVPCRLRARGTPRLHTPIDLDLQQYIARSFPPGQRGAVLALNPNTGEVLALYSAPTFNPNAFVSGISPAYWRTLSESPSTPLLDRAIKARYPPGSTWKLAVAAMGLKRGIVGPRSHMPIPCRGGLQFGNRYFRCWDARGHGVLTLTEAIAQSCDVYFYQLGIKLGVPSILEDANAWGFRGRTGIDLPGELPSEFPTGPEYYDRLYGPRRSEERRVGKR